MSSAKGKLVLILGLQRTGTTLLASMLGGHSEVNMLFESIGSDKSAIAEGLNNIRLTMD